MEVVTKEEFLVFVEEFRAMQREVSFLRSLLTGGRWLSRQQTMQALDVSESTLWLLTRSGQLTYRKEKRRIFYDVDSVRSYLTGKKIDAWRVDSRILKATHSV